MWFKRKQVSLETVAEERHVHYNKRLAQCEGQNVKLRQDYGSLKQKLHELSEQHQVMQAAFVEILEQQEDNNDRVPKHSGE